MGASSFVKTVPVALLMLRGESSLSRSWPGGLANKPSAAKNGRGAGGADAPIQQFRKNGDGKARIPRGGFSPCQLRNQLRGAALVPV